MEYLEGWLANRDNWVKMKGLGKGFEYGAKFIPISGDGNCFFSACSTYTTASKALPNGTPDNHAILRKAACDLIVKKKDMAGNIKDRLLARKTPLTGAAFNAYIAKKRAVTGQGFTWSDNITFDAMAQHLDRPIMQLTYPRYVNGEKKPELEPKFMLSMSGARTKLPVYIHYNGINHYNCFVPRI